MTTDYLTLAEAVLKIEEGLSLVPYYCTEGYPTIGYGEKMGGKFDPLPEIVWTKAQARAAMQAKFDTIAKDLAKGKTKAAWDSLAEDVDRKTVMVSMAYQLGVAGLGAFTNTLKAISEKNWEVASAEMLSSLAAKQTPKRWKRQATAMLTGSISKTYKI